MSEKSVIFVSKSIIVRVMQHGFIKVGAAVPLVSVADTKYNTNQLIALAQRAHEEGAEVTVFPELCITGYTCGDLFLQPTLLKGAEEGLATILEATKHLDILTAVGMPVRCKWDNKLYNCAVLFQSGKILGVIPKTYLPNYGENADSR